MYVMQTSYIFEVASCLQGKIIELLSWREAMVFEMEIDICAPRDIQPITGILHLCDYFQREVS